MYGQDMLAMLATRTSGPVILADWRCNVMANEVEIIVEPVEPSGLPVERLREWLAGDRHLQEVLGDVDIENLLLSQPETCNARGRTIHRSLPRSLIRSKTARWKCLDSWISKIVCASSPVPTGPCRLATS